MADIAKWREFWEASSLSLASAREFGERARAFRPMDPAPEPYAQSGAEHPLPVVRDRLQRLLHRRRSERAFSTTALSESDISKVLSSFAAVDGHRVYPSAGGLYPIHVFGLMLNAVAPWTNTAVRYEPSTHSLAVMQQLDSVGQVELACSIDADIHPQMVLVFVVNLDEQERKYDERALRFALIEVGHMAQNLGLRLAKSKMNGYELGGMQDDAIKALLGLQETSALIAHGFACGRP